MNAAPIEAGGVAVAEARSTEAAEPSTLEEAPQQQQVEEAQDRKPTADEESQAMSVLLRGCDCRIREGHLEELAELLKGRSNAYLATLAAQLRQRAAFAEEPAEGSGGNGQESSLREPGEPTETEYWLEDVDDAYRRARGALTILDDGVSGPGHRACGDGIESHVAPAA